MDRKVASVPPDYCRARVLVLGCGNVLFGDDGFGPAVVAHLRERFPLPSDVCVVDAGSRAREILFTLALGEARPQRLVIVDAVDAGRKPGEVFEIDIGDLPRAKIDDFSMHQLPTSNLLRELKELLGVDVVVIAAQVGEVPEVVRPGLSPALQEAVPVACERVRSRSSARGPARAP
jgi:coenzyme F420 hydrogenase subunit delta